MNGRKNRETLPIDNAIPQVLDAIDNHQVVIVQAETGAGKTTRLPTAVLEAALVGDLPMQIWLTQPRRAAVRWNGARIAHELGCQPGDLVGWRLHGEEPLESAHTCIHLRVDQSLANSVRRTGELPQGLIVVDEAHERSLSIDLLLGMIKEMLPDSPHTRVMIMSATIDAEKFSAYFGGAPIISVKGRCFPVRTQVLTLQRGEHHTTGTARAINAAIDDFASGKLLVPTPDSTGTTAVTKGKILVLLPGKEEIASVMDSVKFYLRDKKELDRRIQIIPCHGESTSDEQDAVQAPVEDGQLVIVCGTEILRNSVTVCDTIGVVDALRVKRNHVDAHGRAHLSTIAVSRAEAMQAQGRAGRTQPGFYTPVAIPGEYEGLAPYPLPATQREPVTSIALQVAAMERSIRDFPFLDPPQSDKVDVAIRRLKQVGALDNQERITKIGQLIVQFPIDPELARALLTADELDVLSEALVAVAALESEGFFHAPKRDVEKLEVQEDLARLVLSRAIKDQCGDWGQAREPRDPANVDLTDLPRWIKQVGDDTWELDLGYPCPFDEARNIFDLQKAAWAGDSRSDFVAIVNAYRAFKAEERRLRDVRFTVIRDGKEVEAWLSGHERDSMLRDWCMTHFVNYKRTRMTEQVIHEIRNELANSPLGLRNGLAHQREFSAEALTKSLASGLTDNIGLHTGGGGYYSGMGEFQIPFASVCKGNPALCLAGGLYKIPGGRKGHEITLADSAAPVKAPWMLEVMPHLCTTQRRGDHGYDLGTDEVRETQVISLRDQEIGRDSVPSSDDATAAKVFASWLSSQQQHSTLASCQRNWTIVRHAAELNRRAGSAVATVSTQQALAVWLLSQLSGARRLGQIKDETALHLPAIDEELAALVMSECPDMLDVLGTSRNVQYRDNAAPLVVLAKDVIENGSWQQLLDEGYKLPGGRSVEIRVEATWSASFTGTDIPKLKTEVRDHINKTAWESWCERPAIISPDLTNTDTAVPDVIEAQYGLDCVSGARLLGYGVVAVNTGRYWSGDPWFKILWTRDRQEVEAARTAAIAKLAELRQELAARKEAEELKARAAELYNSLYYDSRDSGVKAAAGRLYNPMYNMPTSELSAMRTWIEGIRSLISQVETAQHQWQLAQAEIERLKPEAEALRQRAQEAYDRSRDPVDVRLPGELEERLYGRTRSFPEGNLAEIRQWMDETSVLLREVETASETERQIQAEAAKEPGFAEALEAVYGDRELAQKGITFARAAVEVYGLDKTSVVLREANADCSWRTRHPRLLERMPKLADKPETADVWTATRDRVFSPIVAAAQAWTQVQLKVGRTTRTASKPAEQQSDPTTPPSADAMESLLARFGSPSRLSDVGKDRNARRK